MVTYKQFTSVILMTVIILGTLFEQPVKARFGLKDFDPTNRNSKLRKGGRSVDITNRNSKIRGFLRKSDPTTRIGDFLDFGTDTVHEVQKSIRIAGKESRKTLQEFNNNMNGLIKTISHTYQDNLNITIDSLDTFTRKKIDEAIDAIKNVNDLIQEDIKLVSLEAQSVIRTSSLEIQQITRQLEDSFKNIIIVGTESTAYIIDRTVYNGVMFTSILMLGGGLLFFIWILFVKDIKEDLPVGIERNLVFAFGTIYIFVFGGLGLLPPARSYAMAYSGVGLQKRLSKYNKSQNIRPNSHILTGSFIDKNNEWIIGIEYVNGIYRYHAKNTKNANSLILEQHEIQQIEEGKKVAYAYIFKNGNYKYIVGHDFSESKYIYLVVINPQEDKIRELKLSRISENHVIHPPTKPSLSVSSHSLARQRLGARVMSQLFHQIVEPMATTQTAKAFLKLNRIEI